MAMIAVITAATTPAPRPATPNQTRPNCHQGLPASGCEGACAGADTAGLEDMGNLFLSGGRRGPCRACQEHHRGTRKTAFSDARPAPECTASISKNTVCEPGSAEP